MAFEAVVSFVARKLGDLLIEETGLLYGVHDQFQWIERELRHMQCFLKDADAKQKGDERVKNWVAQIRDVSYDTEDVIDTFILTQTAKIAQRRRRRGLPVYVKRYMICIFSDLITRYKVSQKIRQIKLRIEGISKTALTYGIKDINDREQETSLNVRRQSFALFEEPDIIGLQEIMRNMKEQLINDEERRSVISIVGMGGSGKTTIAKKVYNDVIENFDCHAFMFLSQQYNIQDILIHTIKCIMRPSRDALKELEKSNEQELSKKLRHQLSKKRYLIVIDDIWTREAWDALKHILPDDMNKSRVLLTTRNKEVALHADCSSNSHDIRLLNEDESWELFLKRVFQKGVVCPPELKEIGSKFLAKCRGLPLAILVLGGLLSRKEKTVNAWSKVLNSVTWHLAQESDQCMEILALSYYDLPHYLKPCFLYLGLFPEDFEIRAKELIKLWIAEGFIQKRDKELIEDVAEDHLEELVGRSMIQVVRKRANGSISKCRIHDLLRDLSISEARQVNFFGIDSDNDTASSSTSLRRVALHRCVDEYETINHSAAALRSMLCFSDSTFHLSKLLNRGGKLLRVLHVNDSSLPTILPNDIGEEVHLRYLISRVWGTLSLPSSIGNLCNLQTLKFHCNGLLPNAIWDLERLRHLDAFRCKIDGRPRLKNLRNLQTLCLTAGSWIEEGLDELTNLRKLGILGDLRSLHKALSDALQKLYNLQAFTLSGSIIIQWSASLANHQRFYRMSLDGQIEKLPNFPPNLAKLTLYFTNLQEDSIEILEKLPHLQILKFRQGSYCGEKMSCSSGGFPQLEYLELNCPSLNDLIAEEGAMPSIKKVDYLPNLKTLPKQVQDLLKPKDLPKEDKRSINGFYKGPGEEKMATIEKGEAILFSGTMSTGEAAWTPAFGTIPDDMLRMPSENHNLSFANNPMSLQSSNFQEKDQEIGLEKQLAEVRRKHPCSSRRMKDSRNDALVVSIDNLVSSIDPTFKTDGPTIAECIASLKKFPNVPDSLYIYALNAFRIKENREVWMSEDDDRIRMMWLKANADGGFVA